MPPTHTMPESDEDAREAVEKVFGVRPCLWQLKAARTILGGQDTLTIAPTGSGKTLSSWLALVFVPEGTSHCCVLACDRKRPNKAKTPPTFMPVSLAR
ncbi:MAG: hypothetical protein NXY57DRAFT_653669 [Lentinula lateritia]|nr:MAG: hypothetical protein NXY57DRAFT_653669 [Lentinula lateritia]